MFCLVMLISTLASVKVNALTSLVTYESAVVKTKHKKFLLGEICTGSQRHSNVERASNVA